jgi:hypothetical protein
MNLFMLVFGVLFAVAFLFILGTSGVMAFNIFRLFNRIQKNVDNAAMNPAEAHAEKKRRALEVVAGQPPGTPAHKCRNCGATVDSTAELSADGKVRCNYCNQWSSIYQ